MNAGSPAVAMGPGAAPAGARFSRPVRLALWQGALNAPGEWEAELREVARSAKEGGAELLLTPELCLPGFHFFGHSGFSAQREAVEARIATIASEEGLALCVGYAERRHGARDFWNTAVLVDSAGQVRHRYRKHHLWGNEANLGIVASDEDLEVVEGPKGVLNCCPANGHTKYFERESLPLLLKVRSCPDGACRRKQEQLYT
ncbi:unnamed protein product [Prorocentrum cordatum]|uniref:CN hydrolase domain-containing protein n=1 Tax=Prorocentrum cordatum TaxID=2364126 RepID=A0ABN9PBE8_9DINO|nr:unnamed protein product [Polarella glacialis]